MTTLLTIEEVADILRVSEKQVRRFPIPQVRLGPRTIRYEQEDIEAYIKRKKLGSA